MRVTSALAFAGGLWRVVSDYCSGAGGNEEPRRGYVGDQVRLRRGMDRIEERVRARSANEQVVETAQLADHLARVLLAVFRQPRSPLREPIPMQRPGYAAYASLRPYAKGIVACDTLRGAQEHGGDGGRARFRAAG
jgi:hypothetical protein